MKVGDHLMTKCGKRVHEVSAAFLTWCGIFRWDTKAGDKITTDPVTCKKCFKAKEKKAC